MQSVDVMIAERHEPVTTDGGIQKLMLPSLYIFPGTHMPSEKIFIVT